MRDVRCELKGRQNMTTNALVLEKEYVQAALYLSVLQIRLQLADVYTLYGTPRDGPPRLAVTDPSLSAHEDVIHAAPRLTGTGEVAWWFAWDWGEWVCRADHVGQAVTRIAGRLRRP
jgi:hypothetical protein